MRSLYCLRTRSRHVISLARHAAYCKLLGQSVVSIIDLTCGLQVVLVPGLFGNRSDAWTDGFLTDKMNRYWEWAQQDKRVAGFNPYHLNTRTTCVVESSLAFMVSSNNITTIFDSARAFVCT